MVNSAACVSIILACCVLWVACTFPVALSCDSCGRECASACGTRHFRTCCFNYLRKRSVTPPVAPPGLKLELWLAKSRMAQAAKYNPHFNDLLLGNEGDADNDYELIMPNPNRLHLGGKTHAVSAEENSQKYHHIMHQDPEDSHSSERTNDKTLDEPSDNHRLQMLYDS